MPQYTNHSVAGGLPPAASPPPEPVRLGWTEAGGMLLLSIINFCLRIVTLGVYHFWGKTEVRRRIWSSVRINGEPLAYKGTGKELFLGFLVVFGVVVIPTMLVSFGAVLVFGPQSPLIGAFQMALYAFFFLLTGVAIHRAQRYRLSRTEWRGIRGGMAGSAWRFAWTYLWTALLIPFTLGWIIPWRSTRIQALLSNDMRFGDRPFRFTATSGPLYPRFIGLWIGGVVVYFGFFAALFLILWPGIYHSQESGLPYIPTGTEVGLMIAAFLAFILLYGLISAWYRAGMMNHFAAHTTFEGARFSGRADAPSLIWLTVSNLLMVLLTIGLLTPVAQTRAARYFVQRLSLDGSIPMSAIAQGAEDKLTRGEGLAQAFDVDAF